MNDLQELLSRYDKPGPRYTSYPTAPVWSDEFSAPDYAARLRAGGQSDEVMSLYAHIPYCNAMCFFCGCATVITQRHEKAAPYVDRLLREAAMVHAEMGGARRVAQHHWGGGTPTFLAPEFIEKLFIGLCELFPLTDDAEVSIEVDPRVTTRQHIETLARIGFNRISMGVQDFDPKVQKTINRVQSFAQTEAIVTGARELGFDSVNLDLIYGLPYQTKAGFQRTLDAVHELNPDRIACYSYAHVPWIRKHQKVIPEDSLPRGGDKLELYLTALRDLVDHGYEAIGMDHFARRQDDLAVAARQGSLHRNFMGYTTLPAEDMLAFGMSAISEFDGAFSHNYKTLQEWEARIDAGELPVERGMVRSVDDDQRRRIILDLMCHFRLEFGRHGGGEEFQRRYAAEFAELQPMVADGLLTIDAEGIEVTETGRLFVRNICMPFDAYLRRDEQQGPMFSRTV
jgi:oxygen-independent coproporphyrinogen-3 oxidase